MSRRQQPLRLTRRGIIVRDTLQGALGVLMLVSFIVLAVAAA